MALTNCACLLKSVDATGTTFSGAELTFAPRKTQVNSGDAMYLSRSQKVRAKPSVVIQDLTFVAVEAEPTSAITIDYNSGGTAGSEVVSVTGSAITITLETGVSTATQVRTAFNNSAAATALATCVLSGTGSDAQTSFGSAVTLDTYYFYMSLAETTTNAQLCVFSVDWDVSGSNYGSVVFDPVQIPNQSFLDLSTLLTVSRG